MTDYLVKFTAPTTHDSNALYAELVNLGFTGVRCIASPGVADITVDAVVDDVPVEIVLFACNGLAPVFSSEFVGAFRLEDRGDGVLVETERLL